VVLAARALFASLGFERTTVRAVARKAGVDVALIYHHFGSKTGLLEATLAVPASAQSGLRAIPAGTPDPGRAIVTTVLCLWESDPALREQALAMIRTALSHEHAAQRLQELHRTAVMLLVSELTAEDHRELRAALIGAQLSGLMLTRYLFKVNTVAAADPTLLIAAVAPTIEHYLTGDLAGGIDPRANGKRGSRKSSPSSSCP
jgi:AcrR family transcriptional regulator